LSFSGGNSSSVFSDVKTEKYCLFNISTFSLVSSTSMPSDLRGATPELSFYMPEIKVTILGTEKLIKNLDPTKATGPDQILARILKQIAAEFAPHLTTIFNKYAV
jgi:hypothetical protein